MRQSTFSVCKSLSSPYFVEYIVYAQCERGVGGRVNISQTDYVKSRVTLSSGKNALGNDCLSYTNSEKPR